MTIPILIEPNLKDTIWSREICEGLKIAIAKKNYEAYFIEGASYQSFDYKAFFGKSTSLLLLFGTSPSWLYPTIQFFSTQKIGIILLGNTPLASSLLQGQVYYDYENSVHQLLDYLTACKCKKTALYGVFENSVSDLVKKKAFLDHLTRDGVINPEEYVIENQNNLDECYASLFNRIEEFDSALCVNEIVAVSLLQKLQASGIRVPEDFQIITYGSSKLPIISTPALSTYVVDHMATATQAIKVYKYLLSANDPNLRLSVMRTGVIETRESTVPFEIPQTKEQQPISALSSEASPNFYDDKTVSYFTMFEHFLHDCDSLDLDILRKVLQNIPYEKIAEDLHTARNTIIFRLNKLQAAFSLNSKKELKEFFRFHHFDEIILSDKSK